MQEPLSDRLRLAPEGMDESAWLEVIQKMDEVYTQLIADEVALEAKNAQLEQSQRFIFGLLHAMSDVLVATDREGRIEETNPALCALVGRSDTALLGERVDALLADDDSRQRLQTLRARAGTKGASGGEALELRFAGRGDDSGDEGIPVEVTVSMRRDAGGRVVGHLLVGRPLGELRQAYLQLQQAHEALKRTQQQLLHSEKMASLGRLVAGVAHELNNPISFILGNMQALGRYHERLQGYIGALHAGADAQDAERLRRELRIDKTMADLPSLIEGMREGAHRTAEIVAGLKRFSAMDREGLQPLDLREVVERAVHWVRKGTAPGFDVQVHASDLAPMVDGASGPLLQVFMNLIQNAADACADERDARLTIQIAPVNGVPARVAVAFEDNGPGVPAAFHDRIFEPFFTTKPVGKGTGLGLSISYGIVEQHGGTLRLEPLPGRGSRFVVELPRARAA